MFPVYSFTTENSVQRALHRFRAGETIQGIFLTDKGGRQENQDACVYAQAWDESWVFCAADGLGGHAGGRMAAQCAIRGAIDVVERKGFDGLSPTSLEDIFLGAQAEMVRTKENNPFFHDMRSTFVVLLIKGEMAQWGHVGDIRLYHLRHNDILSQTKDQSVPQMLATMGEIKPEEIRHHPDRSRLLQALGKPGETIKPVYSGKPEKLVDNDFFVLMSDGFWEWIDENILKKLYTQKDLSDALALAETTLRQNVDGAEPDYDNYTAIMLRYMGKTPEKTLLKKKFTDKFWSFVKTNHFCF